MTSDFPKFLLPSVFLHLGLAVLSAQPATNPKRIYVEPFATKDDATQLRESVVSALRRLPDVAVVDKEAGADLVLGGGGDIWVRGYRSLNPRAARVPQRGTAVYSGFLSVELRDPKGLTVWSYLATPESNPIPGRDEIHSDLGKQIATRAAIAVRGGIVSPVQAAPSTPAVSLSGAGATFPYPLYRKWFANYGRANPNVEIRYDPVGSEAGIRQLVEGAVDFGASDSPDAVHAVAPGREAQFLSFPSVVGAVVPIVNLPGLAGEVSFTPEILAGIYLGNITRWNDPALKAANRRLHLPDLAIIPVHRRDGSGTSYVWTDFLAATDPAWKSKVGSGMAPSWPVGRSATGNEGVAGVVKEFGGAIGYVEFTFALQNRLSVGKVRNRQGQFVGASMESVAVAAKHAIGPNGEIRNSIVDAPGDGAYPIASFTWLVVPEKAAAGLKRDAIAAFLKWMVGPGQRQAAALGYLALPPEVVAKVEAEIPSLR